MALEDYRGDIDMCCRCSACKHIPLQRIKGIQHSYSCPSIARFNFHSYSGGGRLLIAREMLKSGFEYTDKLMHILNESCQMCGACDISCKYAMDMEVLEPINEFRIKCVETGHTNPALEKAIAHLRQQGSLVKSGAARRGAWAEGLGIKDCTREKVEVVFHVGCLTSFNRDLWKTARATASLLQRAGIDFGIAGDRETCCGGRAYQMGYKEDFLKQAQKINQMLANCGAKTLVTGCADGYQAFKVLYDKFGLKGDVEVLHITELLARLVRQGKIKPVKRADLVVTYHDPCRLGRLGEPYIHWQGQKAPGPRFVFDPPKTYRRGTQGIYEPPREVLRSIPGLKLVEMDRTREYAWCCGAGGGVNETNPEFARWTAAQRVEEARAAGAQALVSACPYCEDIFRQVAPPQGGLAVYDVVDLLAESL